MLTDRLTDWLTDRLTDRQTHRKDKNYIPPSHTSYARGIKITAAVMLNNSYHSKAFAPRFLKNWSQYSGLTNSLWSFGNKFILVSHEYSWWTEPFKDYLIPTKEIYSKYSDTLTLSTLGNIFSRQHSDIFFLFFQESRFWHFMRDNLHEMSKPAFW